MFLNDPDYVIIRAPMRWIVLLLLWLPPAWLVGQTSRAVSPYMVGLIDSREVRESSGIVQSRKDPGVFWTHNDGGNPSRIYAIDRVGKTLAAFDVDVANRDWEDIAADEDGHLYIAETGNNTRAFRQIAVYQIDEPDIESTVRKVGVKKAFQLRFPNGPFDVESLFVSGEHGYLISKNRDGSQAGVYRFSLMAEAEYSVLEHVVNLPIRMPCTAADMSADGSRLVVQTITGPYLFNLAGDLASLARAVPRQVAIFDLGMEGVCLVADGVVATNERRQIYFFPFDRFE